MKYLLLILSLAMAPMTYAAVEPDEMLADPVLEKRAQELGKEIRCLVCRSESIEDSNADLARDLRLVIREQIAAGQSDDEVLGFLTERYGDFVRLRPRFGGATLWLWLSGPILVLLGAGVAVAFVLRGRNDVERALTDDEEDALQALLNRDEPR